MGIFDQMLLPPEEEAQPPVPVGPPAPPPAYKPGIFNEMTQPPVEPPAPPTTGQAPPQQAELRSYTPTPTEWVTNKVQDALHYLGADAYTSGRLAKGLTNVAKIFPPAAAVSAGADTAFKQYQGDYGGAALDALGLIPAGKMGETLRTGVSLPEVLPPNFADVAPGGMTFRETPLGKGGIDFTPAPTSGQQLASGEAGYEAFRTSPQTYPPKFATDLAADTRTALSAGGMYPGENKGVHEAISVLEDKAANNGVVTRPDIDEFRAALSKLKKGSQAPAAMEAQSVLYDKMAQTGDRALQQATEDYGAGRRTGIVEQILSKSEMAKNPDVDLANRLRREVQTRAVRPRGFEQSEVDALDAARKGSLGVRAAEAAGNAIQKYGTVIGTGAGVAPTIAGLLTGHFDPMAATKSLAIGVAGPGAVGSMIKAGAGRARQAATQEAADLVAMRSPLYRDAFTRNLQDQLFLPSTDQQRSAITQQLINRFGGQ